MREAFDKSGRIWFRNALSNRNLDTLDSACTLELKAGARMNSNSLGGVVKDIASIISPLTPSLQRPKAVRTVAFNKTSGSNWGVPWHQDRVIAVCEKHEIPEFANWSKKGNIWHCEPPLALLAPILFVRVHLDRCDFTSGAMQIAVGSHIEGHVEARLAKDIALKYPIETCEAERGDILVLKMLTLHRSSPAQITSSRRTLRIDFTTESLPSPLEWGG